MTGVNFDDDIWDELDAELRSSLAEAMQRFQSDLGVIAAGTDLTFHVQVAIGTEVEDAEGEAEQGDEEGPSTEA